MHFFYLSILFCLKFEVTNFFYQANQINPANNSEQEYQYQTEKQTEKVNLMSDEADFYIQ